MIGSVPPVLGQVSGSTLSFSAMSRSMLSLLKLGYVSKELYFVSIFFFYIKMFREVYFWSQVS